MLASTLVARALARAATSASPSPAAAATLLLRRAAASATSSPSASASAADAAPARSNRGASQPPPIAPPPSSSPPLPDTPLHAVVNGRRVTLHPPSSSSSASSSSPSSPWPPTLLDFAAAAGASVPTLCKNPKSGRSPGTCRVCMVELDGGRLAPACCTPLPRDGAALRTDTDAVISSVRGTLALLRRGHPEGCMSCSASGSCEFQDLVARYDVPLLLPKAPHLRGSGGGNGYRDARAAVAPLGPDGSAAVGGKGPTAAAAHDAWLPYDASSTAIALDADKCIQCGRCVEVCSEQQGMDVLAFFGRGADRHLGFAASDAAHSHCIGCGQCVSSCPVGALSERTDWREVLGLLQQRRQERGREAEVPRREPKRESPRRAAAPAPASASPSSSSPSTGGRAAGSPRTFASQAQRQQQPSGGEADGGARDEPQQRPPARPRRPVLVAQTAPSVRVALAEEVGLAPGSVTGGQLVAALRALGFDYVFDTDFAADLTVVEEGHELMARLAEAWAREALGDGEGGGGSGGGGGGGGGGSGDAPALPMMTSCCPAWVHLVEDDYPSLIPNLSSCKSPQGMLAAVIKRLWWPRERQRRRRLRRRQDQEGGAEAAGAAHDDDENETEEEEEECFHVSVMPCVAKKAEAARPQLAGDVDRVLTTRELGRMLRLQRVPVASLPAEGPESRYDDPLGVGTGAGVLFGASGGVMEAALRTVYELATGKELGRLTLRPASDAAFSSPRSPYAETTPSGHTQGAVGALSEASVELPVAPVLRLGLGARQRARAERAIAALGGEGATREVRLCVASGVAAARRMLDADAAARAAAASSGAAGGGGGIAPASPARPSSSSSTLPPAPTFLSSIHFLEVMSCVSGCVNGGGQPKAPPVRPGHPETSWPAIVAARSEAIRALDRAAPLRRSHLNPAVRALYGGQDGDDGGGNKRGEGNDDDDGGDDDDDDPSLPPLPPPARLRGGVGGHDAHALLHTYYRAFEGGSERELSPPYSSEWRAGGGGGGGTRSGG